MTHPLNNNKFNTYRPDIDGLRAIAVLSVIAFHAFPNSFRGGFVGVDVFFVISGYLITSLISKELASGCFSLVDFYQRRAQRLFPALILVLIATQIYSPLLYKDEATAIAESITAGAIFIANYFFWIQGGYFDAAPDSKPLLHLWSLSIEEQFYLLWPILFLFVRTKNAFLKYLIVFAFIGSFSYSVMMSRLNSYAAFYSLQSRAWEFGIGIALALFRLRENTPASRWLSRSNNLLSWLGLGMILTSVVFLKSSMPFPGLAALPPVIGATLIILAGPNSFINQRILSRKSLVWVGLLSYPLYLWHWPLLVFTRIELSMAPPIWLRLVLIAVSFALAYLTYRLIETPIRRTPANWKKTVVLTSLLLIIAGIANFTTPSSVRYSAQTAEDRVDFENYYLNNISTRSLSVFESEYRHECNFYQIDKYYAGAMTMVPRPSIDPSCYTKRKPTDKAVLIWGDSHAQMLNYGLRQVLPDDWSILQVSSSGCYPNADYKKASDTDYCARSNWFAMEVVRSQKIDVVVLAQSREHDIGQMNLIAQTLERAGVSRVIVMGPAPKWTDLLPKIILRHLWEQKPNRTTVGVDQETIKKNRDLSMGFKRSDHRIYADIIGLFCNNQGCLTEAGSDQKYNLTTWDTGHFTSGASKLLAEKLLANLILGKTW